MLARSSSTTRDVVRKVKGALLPLRCTVEIIDRAQENAPTVVRLSVLNPGQAALHMPTITLGSLRDERALDRALWNTRMELERQGYILN